MSLSLGMLFCLGPGIVYIMNKLWDDGQGFESQYLQEIFHFSKTSKTALGPTEHFDLLH
jgi:hypothetical protein